MINFQEIIFHQRPDEVYRFSLPAVTKYSNFVQSDYKVCSKRVQRKFQMFSFYFKLNTTLIFKLKLNHKPKIKKKKMS